MNNQIQIVKPRPQLQTLYGTMSDNQKNIVIGVTAGAVAGLVLFFVVREMRKRRG